MTTNTSQPLFIEIKPIGFYFFGGERTFNTAETDKYNEAVANYFAISNHYPQQTALLGLMRYTILATIKGGLNTSLKEKKAYIGNAFDGIHKDTYGYIKSISPLCIVRTIGGNKTFSLPAPYTKQTETLAVSYDTQAYESYTRTTNNKSAVLSNFDYKEFDTSIRWVDANNKEYEPFEELERVGVKIKGDQDAFYKQKHYRLKKEFSFGIWVDFSVDGLSLKNNLIAPFGGDQGLSKITFSNEVPSIFKEEQQQTNTITLVSDAYVKYDFFKNVDYGITEFVDFRYIKSKTSDYYAINNQTDKSNKMQLLKRGSVLFCNDAATVANDLRANIAYRKIGYNYFKFI